MGCVHGKCCSRYPPSSDTDSGDFCEVSQYGVYGKHILTERVLEFVPVPSHNFHLEYSVLTQRGYYPDSPDKENQDSFCIRTQIQVLQDVPPAILLRFLREHRSEWADSSIDAYSAAAVKAGPCSLPGSRPGSFGGQVILPLAHTIEHEEFMEVIKLENIGHYREDMIITGDIFLLQVFEKSLQCTFSRFEEYLDLFLTRVNGLRRRITLACEAKDVLDYALVRSTFQDRVGSLKGGIEFLELSRFERIEGGKFLFLPWV